MKKYMYDSLDCSWSLRGTEITLVPDLGVKLSESRFPPRVS